MFSTKLFAAVAVLVLLIAGVSYTDAQETGENLNLNNHKNSNDLLADIASTVPEFGGFYLSKDDNGDVLNIYLTENQSNTEKQSDAREAVEDKFGTDTSARLNIIDGDYTMTQLQTWYSSMRNDVWAHSDVVATDLEEQSNRLEIAIVDLTKTSEIQAILTKLNIPHAAVNITQRGRVVKEQTLRQRARNDEMMAAYQVKSADHHLCSIGFVTEKAESPASSQAVTAPRITGTAAAPASPSTSRAAPMQATR